LRFSVTIKSALPSSLQRPFLAIGANGLQNVLIVP
jgi:hypothetical protein